MTTRNETEERNIVTFTLRGEGLDPGYWTEYFKVKPVAFARKGENIDRNGRKISNTKSKLGFWSFSLSGNNLFLSVDDQTILMAKILGIREENFRNDILEKNVRCELWIFVDNSAGDNPLEYSSVTSEFIAKYGGRLILDVYPPDTTN